MGLSARSCADGGISDAENMACSKSCTVAVSRSICKVEMPVGCRRRRGAIFRRRRAQAGSCVQRKQTSDSLNRNSSHRIPIALHSHLLFSLAHIVLILVDTHVFGPVPNDNRHMFVIVVIVI